MNYQQFDEKLQSVFEMTPKREKRLRVRWQNISRRGPLFFVLTRGTILFVWMVFCLTVFSIIFHTLHVYADLWVAASALAGMLILSLVATLASYRMTKGMVVSLDMREARRLRRQQRASFSPAAPGTAP